MSMLEVWEHRVKYSKVTILKVSPGSNVCNRWDVSHLRGLLRLYGSAMYSKGKRSVLARAHQYLLDLQDILPRNHSEI